MQTALDNTDRDNDIMQYVIAARPDNSLYIRRYSPVKSDGIAGPYDTKTLALVNLPAAKNRHLLSLHDKDLPTLVYIQDASVVDPDTGHKCTVHIYKHPTSGALIGIDESFPADKINSPYTSGVLRLPED